MVYSNEGAKWKAYQFSDPFAAGSFYVCNKLNKTFCRPDCDAKPITNLKSEIKFVDSDNDAMKMGYSPCEFCDPLSSPSIDVKLLIQCVAAVNDSIGFMPPLLDENEEKNNRRIKENISESKKLTGEQLMKHINSTPGGRRLSAPTINYDGKFTKEFDSITLSKNDSDHYRLADLACRHLALAAAINLFKPDSMRGSKSPEEPSSPTSTGSKKRRRRGGVLGFKELAAKSKLSAWHFHRVFKSVTRLTPKTYGDKCWEYLKNYKDSGKSTSFIQDNQTPITSIANESSVPTSPESIEPVVKRQKVENASDANLTTSFPDENLPIDTLNSDLNVADETPLSLYMLSNNKSPEFNFTSNEPNPIDFGQPILNTNFNMFEEDMSDSYGLNRAQSTPNLQNFLRVNEPTTLFEHSQSVETGNYPSLEEPEFMPNFGNVVEDNIDWKAQAPSLNMTNDYANEPFVSVGDFNTFIDSMNDDFSVKSKVF